MSALVFASAALASTGAAGGISTVAGTGTQGFGGDLGPATAAALNAPSSVAATSDGGFLIADLGNNRIRKVSPTGTITTVAGTGVGGSSGDGGAATSAQLNAPTGVAPTPDGGFLIADAGNNRIREVSPTGTITTVAGNGVAGFSGDGGAATSAQLNAPTGVAPTPDGGFLIADYKNNRIREVSPTGTITTVAGTGVAGFSGDGSPATSAQVTAPTQVIPTSDGGFLIADFGNNRIRKVSATGTITTVAGTGVAGFSGDGGAATAAELRAPSAVAPSADGGFLIADFGNNAVREVSATGTITTVAGTGAAGFSGDGGPATAAELNGPAAVSPTADGGFLVADFRNNRVRQIQPPATSTGTTGSTGTTTGSTGPITSAPSGSTRYPLVHLSSAPLTLTRAGTVPVTVACSATQTSGCRGTIILRLVLGPRHHSRTAQLSRRARPPVLGRENYKLAAGRTKTVKVKIARRGRAKAEKARKQHRKVNVKISVVQQTPSGPRTSERVVPLRTPHHRARR